jgi:phytoene dehydrogenase-like protein
VSDAVVIGSGPNGLAAAIRLAEAGRSVVVLEGARHPGGAVRTEELTLPGFHHDTFSSVYPAGAASPAFARMPLAEHGLEWVHPEACYAHPLPDGRAAVLYRDVARTAASLDELHPGDGRRWAHFARPLIDNYDALRDTILAGFPPLSGPLRLAAGVGPRALPDLVRLLGSATGFAHHLFRSEASRAWLYGSARHSDAPLEQPGSAMAAVYLNLFGHAVGWPSPRGGAGRLADALLGYLASLGGQVRTGARAEGILTKGGRVAGVGIDGGELIPARVVVADVMPHALLRLTGNALSAWYRAALRRYVYGPATVKLDWALDGPIPWTNDQARRAGTVHLLAPGRPFVLLGQQTVADPTRAPAGKHTAWAYTHDPATTPERMEAYVERYAPGFRGRIRARHVLTPGDLESRNPNLVHGDVGGGSYRFRQLVFRPLPKLSPYATPVDGLYLGSAATFPGGGVHGVPGDAAARAALRHSGA